MTPSPASADNSSKHKPADHWRRFRRLMLFMTVAAVATAALAIWQMRVDGVPMRLHFAIAMAGGIFITLLLAGALMGLAFVSSRSGHDEAVNSPED